MSPGGGWVDVLTRPPSTGCSPGHEARAFFRGRHTEVVRTRRVRSHGASQQIRHKRLARGLPRVGVCPGAVFGSGSSTTPVRPRRCRQREPEDVIRFRESKETSVAYRFPSHS